MTERITFYTAGDVAKLKGVTSGAVRLAEQRGVIRASARTAGGVKLYTIDDARSYIESPRRGMREAAA